MWKIVFVDNSNRLRNGGKSMLKEGDSVEAEARRRAEQHNSLVSYKDRVMNVVCLKTTG